MEGVGGIHIYLFIDGFSFFNNTRIFSVDDVKEKERKKRKRERNDFMIHAEQNIAILIYIYA